MSLYGIHHVYMAKRSALPHIALHFKYDTMRVLHHEPFNINRLNSCTRYDITLILYNEPSKISYPPSAYTYSSCLHSSYHAQRAPSLLIDLRL